MVEIARTLFAIFFITVFILFRPPENAVASEYPEANPLNAFNATESQKIKVSDPLFFSNLVQPLIRVTITLYKNNNGEFSMGFVGVTHSGYRDGDNVTYYFQIVLSRENLGMVAVNVWEPWGDAYGGIVPKKETDFVSNKNIFKELPNEAKLLWISVPFSFIIKEVGENQGFSLFVLYGDRNFNGRISWPVASAKYYSEIQNGQKVFIWAFDGIGVPDSIKWSTKDLRGVFEWGPGMSEPKFVPNDLDI